MAKHDRILKDVFARPTKGGIVWGDIESLMVHRGAVVEELRGSAIRVTLGTEKAYFHRPHPRKEASKGAVESARIFLENAGIRPD